MSERVGGGYAKVKRHRFETAARHYTAKTGSSKVLLLSSQSYDGFGERNERRRGGIHGEGGRWLQQACTTMFFLISKYVTSDRPIALMLAMIRR